MRISDWSADVCSSDLSRGLICATTQVSDCPHLRRGTLKPMMRHAQDLPQRAIVWCRISDARDEDTTGVDDQAKHIRGLADRLDWGIGPAATHIIVHNATPAYKRKRNKPPDGRTARPTVRPPFPPHP